MSPTLLEGAIAIFLVVMGWRIGVLLAPWIIRRRRDRLAKKSPPPGRNQKPPNIIDV